MIMSIATIRPLLLAARRTDPTLATQVEKGRFRLASVTYTGSRSTVRPLTDWIDLPALLRELSVRAGE